MVVILGIPLIGSFFFPSLFVIGLFITIWIFGTKPKEDKTEPIEIKEKDVPNGHVTPPEEATVNVASAKRKRKVFGNKSGTFARTARFDYKAVALPERTDRVISSGFSPGIEVENEPSKQSLKKKKKPCKGKAGCCSRKKGASRVLEGTIDTVKIFFGTQTGKSKIFSDAVANYCEERKLNMEVIDLGNYDPEDKLTDETAGNSLCVFILPTHAEGKPPESAAWFYKWLRETVNDFRIDKQLLKGMKFAVFGLGNSQYKDHFNEVGKNVDEWLEELNGSRFMKLGVGDEDTVASKFGSIEADFENWNSHLWTRVDKFLKTHTVCQCDETEQEKAHSSSESSCESGGTCSSDEELSSGQDGSGIVDLEELGNITSSLVAAKEKRAIEENGPLKEMVTPMLKESLTKQGYRVIGTHSGVKLCRWTKSMLRGRGGCYKHTFYGIESHRCMEATPSLACANKCVFCWRHHSNPVGTEWRWKMDPPEDIIRDALKNHCEMINQTKGIPGVTEARFKEGLEVKHCALSLVGEPIMYPEINKFVHLLHEKKISSFLVTNAQFPKEIRDLSPVTQLYVSVDASTKSSLKKIDRPLHKDFWERFIDSLKALSEKGQRTVYRLTLVKAWNVEELQNYADLVEIGKPDFIEVKGVTYCGTSKASTLTMKNVPWHDEVVSFVKKLNDFLPDYDIASEHEHSNCLLLAHTKFRVNGEWWTWIDYDKFHELVQEYYATNGAASFKAEDYMAKSPSWAVFGSAERGFDPHENRWHRKNARNKDISGC